MLTIVSLFLNMSQDLLLTISYRPYIVTVLAQKSGLKMITQSITIPQSQSPHLVLRLRPNMRVALNSALDQLADITVNNIDAKDPLSNKIHQWCYEMLNINFEDKNDETAIDTLGDQVVELVKDILINPITKTPYKTPVCVHGWVLEKSMLPFLGNFGEYSITNPDDYPTHPFAKGMLDWVRSLVQSTLIQDLDETPEDQLEMVLFNTHPNLAMDATIRNQPLQGSSLAVVQVFYRTMVSKAIECKRLEQKIAETNHEIIRYQELISVLRASIAREVAVAKAALEAHEAIVDKRIANVEETDERKTAALEARLEEQKKRYNAIHEANQQSLNLTMVRLDHAVERSVKLEASLSHSMQLTQEQQLQIAALQMTVAQQQQSLIDKKPKKSNCTIQ